MADWIMMRIRHKILHREEPQPRPIFFSPEQTERMNRTVGSYQFKGGSNGKKAEAQ